MYDESSIHCGVAVSLLIWFMCDLSEGIENILCQQFADHTSAPTLPHLQKLL